MRTQVASSKPHDDPPRLTVVAGGAGSAARDRASDLPADRRAWFQEIYAAWFDDVVRWIYALGVPAADSEDVAQEIFLVVRRQLGRFDGGNLAGWLYRITQLTARDHRRRAWFRNLVLRRRDVDLDEVPQAGNPAYSYEEAENRRLLQQIVGRLSEKLRTIFVLFEIEGYSGEEIARIQDIPLGTVWTRLHHARKQFWKLARSRRRGEAAGHDGGGKPRRHEERGP